VTFAVVTFPGSNCDRDCLSAVHRILGFEVRNVFHKESKLGSCDAVIIPGGFSYGDYLRAGALAKLSPIMEDIGRFAKQGGPVLGICNGFQILCEAGLLPGALVRNVSLRFLSRPVTLRVENHRSMFTTEYEASELLTMPIAHGEGCYVAEAQTIERLESEKRIVFRYVPSGLHDPTDGNPNGSTNAIAGIINAEGNVMGMMPHPERACDPLIANTDGARMFLSVARRMMETMLPQRPRALASR
jgi:phosphoribosylformylglycinamidine synthase subunit PurQ / glutaminase